MSTSLVVGFVPIARPTFDTALARQTTGQARQQLLNAGFRLSGADTLISSLDEVKAAAAALNDQPLDLLLVLQATFADSTMVQELAGAIKAPLLLWAVPEARSGGRLRLNSLCGVNLASHALTRAGRKYDYIYAPPGDPHPLQKVERIARAGRAFRLLHGARLGLVGEHPAGFDSCRFNSETIKELFGLDVVRLSLDQVFRRVRDIEPQAVEAVLADLRPKLGNLDQLDQAALRGTLSAYLVLRQFSKQEGLAGLAVRCWPEFFTELGCAACGAMSMLSNECTPCSCEADVNGTITQLILQWLSGEPAFGSDLVAVDPDENSAVLWHCGLAPLSMADPAVPPTGTIHSNRRLPLLMEFPLKPGRVTVARLSEATGSYRLVVGGAEMVSAPPSFSGTSGVLRFDRSAADVLDTILSEGLEHHMSLTYGDHVPALLALAGMLNIPVLQL